MFAKQSLRLAKYSNYKRKIYNAFDHRPKTPMKEDKTHPEVHAEGKAQIYTKYIEKDTEGHKIEKEVFYNPVQVFNRDLSVLAMQAYINRIQQESTHPYNQEETSSKEPPSLTHSQPADSELFATSKNSKESAKSSPTTYSQLPTNLCRTTSISIIWIP